MAQQVSLQAATRSGTGKGVARTLRREGKVPGVIYGHNREPEALVLDAATLGRTLVGISPSATILDVTIDGRPPVRALIREIQRHPLRSTDIMHIDLYAVQADEKVAVDVAVHLVGTPDGVRNFGGVLDQVLYALHLEVLPGDIPNAIDVDVTALGLGESIYVRDVVVPNADVMNDEDLPVCTVVAPRVEETPAEGGAEPELIRKPKEEGEDAGAQS